MSNTITIARRTTLTNALRTAAAIYDEDANHIIYAKSENWLAPDRVVDQFRRQADEARALADTIDQSDKIELRD